MGAEIMVKREDVEALLATCEQIHKPNNGVIAECCRAWLALDAAPVFDIHLVHDSSGRCIAANFATRSDPGQRVRLVATSGGDGNA